MKPLHYRRLLVGAILVMLGAAALACNFPLIATGKPTTTDSGPAVISGPGTATRTPFQPGFESPTPPGLPAQTTPAGTDVFAVTAGATAAPSATPTLLPLPDSLATPRWATWPAPLFGTPGPTPVTEVPPALQVISGSDTINILLIGSDRRTTSYRTDTLVIASIRPREQLVTMISIPRDLFVYIPGWTMQRINTAYQHGELSGYPDGGAGLLADTILYNLGIRIDHLAMVDFNGFRRIVDTLGGIEVPVACQFTDWHIIDPEKDDQDEENWQLYTIGPGVVQMDGDLALWYARSRLRSSDFDRGRRQQEVLRAIYAQGMRLGVLPHIPELYRELSSSIETDLALDDLLRLAPLAANLDGPRIRSYYIGRDFVTSWRTPQGAAVLLPRRETLEPMLAEAMGPADAPEAERMALVVEIVNESGNKGWETLAGERLNYAGYETRVVAAESTGRRQTALIDASMEQDLQQAQTLLDILGLPASSLIWKPDPGEDAAYRLILGSDYNPCFNPASLTR